MKKNFATMLLAGVVMIAAFAGCGNKTEGEVIPTPTTAAETQVPTTEATVMPEETKAPTEESTGAPTETPVPTETPAVTDDIAETKITVGQYKGITLYEVDSKVIAQELHEMMEGYAELVTVNVLLRKEIP